MGKQYTFHSEERKPETAERILSGELPAKVYKKHKSATEISTKGNGGIYPAKKHSARRRRDKSGCLIKKLIGKKRLVLA